jgi:hypothetical protein
MAEPGTQRRRAAAFAEGDTAMRTPIDARWHRRQARRLLAEVALADGWGDPVRWLTEDLAFFETLGHDQLASACRVKAVWLRKPNHRRRHRPGAGNLFAVRGTIAPANSGP